VSAASWLTGAPGPATPLTRMNTLPNPHRLFRSRLLIYWAMPNLVNSRPGAGPSKPVAEVWRGAICGVAAGGPGPSRQRRHIRRPFGGPPRVTVDLRGARPGTGSAVSQAEQELDSHSSST
jgi:hypothetical protein